MQSDSDAGLPPMARWTLIVVTPLLALALYFWLPNYLEISTYSEAFLLGAKEKAFIAVSFLMLVWVLTGPIPFAVTMAIPIVAYPMFKIISGSITMASYASAMVFLLMGCSIMVCAARKWNLEKRVNAFIVEHLSGSDWNGVAFILATPLVSLFCAATSPVVLLPFALTVFNSIRTPSKDQVGEGHRHLYFLVLFAVACGASAGIMVGDHASSFRSIILTNDQPFASLTLEFPFLVILLILPCLWFLLRRYVIRWKFPQEKTGSSSNAIKKMGLSSLSKEEKSVLGIYVLATVLWISTAFWTFDSRITVLDLDAMIAIFCAICLFVISVDKTSGLRLLTWTDCAYVSWDVLLLFGGLSAMWAGFNSTGLAHVFEFHPTSLNGSELALISFFSFMFLLFITTRDRPAPRI